MNSRGLILGLIGLNLALAGTALWLARPHPDNTHPTGGPDDASSSKSPKSVTASSAAKEGGSTREARFTWRAVAARDLKAYIANLRRVECPEETVQDIILAEVDRIYRAKEAALGLRLEGAKPWESAELSRSRDFEKISRLRQLRVEKRNLIFELLGLDVAGDIPAIVGSNFNSAWEQALALLPVEKRGPVRAVQDRFWELTETFRRRMDGFLLPEDAEEYRRFRDERLASLKQILTPDELAQVEMRTSTTGRNLRTQLAGFEPNESEFKAIFAAKREAHEGGYLPGQLVGDDPASAGQRQANLNTQAEERIKATLGETRYADYQRSQDAEFQQLNRIAQGAGVAKDAALVAYNAQKAADTRLQQELQTPGLTDAQRTEIAQRIHNEKVEAVKQAFGDTGFQQLLEQMPGRFGPPANRRPSFRRNGVEVVTPAPGLDAGVFVPPPNVPVRP